MKFILGCSVCLGDLQNPLSLHCGHTFCRECLHNSFDKSELNQCPLCRSPACTSTLLPDELIPEVQKIYSVEGTQGTADSLNSALLEQLPSIIICLDCGLTPINPVVLPCQHMFCSSCLQKSLEEELVCPACQEFAFTLQVHVNTKYKDLINWYLQQSQIQEEINQD